MLALRKLSMIFSSLECAARTCGRVGESGNTGSADCGIPSDLASWTVKTVGVLCSTVSPICSADYLKL